MDSGVYNRSLFRKRGTEARDQLRLMGGIMASSPELLQAGMREQQAVMPQPVMAQPQTGQGQVQFLAPNLLQPLQPQPQYQAVAPAPLPQPQQRFQDGGAVTPSSAWERVKERSRARLEARAAREGLGGFDTPTVTGGRSATNTAPLTFDQAVQVGENPASALPQSGLPEDLQAKFAEIDALLKDSSISETQKAQAVLESFGLEPGEDVQQDLQQAVSQLGLSPEREARIDDMNKAMLGFAIAAGDSPRASENIANGMLMGLKQMRDTEIRRAEAELAARTGALAPEDEVSWFDTPRGKLASGYIEKMMEGTMDVETMVDTLNQLDADSPPGAKLGDEFRRALAAGSVPPAPVQTRLSTPAAPTAAPGGEDVNASESVRKAQQAWDTISRSSLSAEEKQARLQAIRQRLIEAGINPDLVR